jgi:predicted Zn-dependent peptidase
MPKRSPDFGPDPRPSFQSRYQKSVLPNGIRVVTEEIPYVRSVSVGAWIDVGSRDERESTNGISHFLEHMVFKGTRRFTAQGIARSLESVGGYLNAFTTKEHTCFYARSLDTYLPTAIDVLSELVLHPVFDPKEMVKEKRVILEELKNIEDDPDDLIHDYLDKSVYQRHPLGYPIIGTAENINQFSKSDLVRYTEAYYIPERIVVAAAGNLRHDDVVALVDRAFRTSRKTPSSTARLKGPKRMTSHREVFERPVTQAHICLGTLGCGAKSRQRYHLLVLNSLLGEGMSSRLFQNIREKYGFAYSVYSFANFMSDTGNFGIYIGTDDRKIDESIALIHKELAKLQRNPVGPAEIRRAKAQLKGSMMLSLESMSNRMMRLGSGEILYGDYLSLDTILKGIEDVAREDLFALAQSLLLPENFSTIIFKPSKAPPPLAAVA